MPTTYVTIGTDIHGRPAQLQEIPAKWWSLFATLMQAEIRVRLEIIQARGNATASAGTHSDGAAIDIRTRSLTAAQISHIVRRARELGAPATWYRTTVGSGPHIHMVPAIAGTRAHYQTLAARQGYDGLGATGHKHRDPTPQPAPHLDAADGIRLMSTQLNPPRQKEKEMENPWTATFGTPSDTAGSRLGRILTAAEHADHMLRPIRRGGTEREVRQEIADCLTELLAQRARLDRIEQLLTQLTATADAS